MAAAVLLIDDNAVQAAVRQAILRRAGHNVITALSAERILERLRAHDLPEPIGLVITDHIMPGMNGSAFAREVRALEPTLPILVVSGLEEAATEYEGLEVVFRTKPLSPDDLLSTVQALLQNHNAT